MYLPLCVGVGVYVFMGSHVLYVHVSISIDMRWVYVPLYIWGAMYVCSVCVWREGHRHGRICMHRRVCIGVCLCPHRRRQLASG